MYTRYLVIAILLTSTLLVIPPATSLNSAIGEDRLRPYVDSDLLMNLQSRVAGVGESTNCSALMEFQAELSSQEIAMAESMGLQFLRRGTSVVHVGRVYSALVTGVDSLDSLREMGLVRASSGGKKFFTSVTSSVPAIGAPTVWENMSLNGTPIVGSGATVAVIDTGANWLHPSFWRKSSGPVSVIDSGGKYYADLDNDTVVDPGEGPINHIDKQNPSAIDVANEYMYIDVLDNGVFDYGAGDRWLGGIDANDDGIITLPSEDVVVLGESKVAILYDQATGLVYMRDTNLTSLALGVGDSNGHGTHVASIIAGGQIGFTSMLGVAPDADLIIIKSPLNSEDILDGIHFAIMYGASIINMSFSSYLGFLDGTDLEDLAVSEAFLKNRTLCTLAAGNLGFQSKHARFQAQPGSSAGATLSVSSPPLYSFISLLWRSSDMDERVILTPPAGDPIDLGSFESILGPGFPISSPDLNAYVFADTSIRGTNRLLVQLGTSSHNWTSGTWQVSMTNPSGEPVWVDGYAWDNNWNGLYLRFTTQVDNTRTISSPGTADNGVVVSSYDDGSHIISPTSSRGPRIDGVPKPEVTAPGVNIYAASNVISGLWTTRSGTSMASPHVAGLLALIFQASGRATGARLLTALLQGAGGYSAHYSPPLGDWGYGLCDSVLSVRHVLEMPMGPGTNLSDWAGIAPIVENPENASLDAGLDIISVRVYQRTDVVALAISLLGEPRFGPDVLSVAWDTDSNLTSGKNGADILANVTGGQALVYEWSDGKYQLSTLVAQYWNVSNTAFLTVDQADPPARGRLDVSTGNQTLPFADSTGFANLENQWRPIVSSLTLNHINDIWQVDVTISDRDTPASLLAVGWSHVDGSMSILESGIKQNSTSLNLTVDTGEAGVRHVTSLLLNVSDEEARLFLAPIMLSSGAATALQFTGAVLYQTVVRVGPLITPIITGELILEGYLNAESVILGLKSEYGYWLNFTLDGADGTYPIYLTPSGLAAGNYSVYAIAIDQSGVRTEVQFAVLLAVTDNSLLILIAAGIVLAVIAVVVLRRLRGRFSKEAGQ